MIAKHGNNMKIEWYYFEANHGKGDGIGGSIKHAVYRNVLSKKVIIENPQQFASYADSILPNIQVMFVGNDELKLDLYDECRKNAIYVHGTLKVHNITRAVEKSKATLQFYYISKSVNSFHNISFSIETSPIIGQNCIVDYEGSLFPGVVTAVNEYGSIKVKCLAKAHAPHGSTWKWPGRVDEHDYPVCDLGEPIKVPKLLPVGSRNIFFHVPELNSVWGDIN